MGPKPTNLLQRVSGGLLRDGLLGAVRGLVSHPSLVSSASLAALAPSIAALLELMADRAVESHAAFLAEVTPERLEQIKQKPGARAAGDTVVTAYERLRRCARADAGRALGVLTNQYLDAGLPADGFFRGFADVLVGTNEAEHAELTSLVSVADRVAEPGIAQVELGVPESGAWDWLLVAQAGLGREPPRDREEGEVVGPLVHGRSLVHLLESSGVASRALGAPRRVWRAEVPPSWLVTHVVDAGDLRRMRRCLGRALAPHSSM